MRINKIVLNNFGSYEGINVFDFSPNGERNIILIGGKNGAGKTTLFTAIRLCLYGYMSMGYKNFNGHYTKAIVKLINNSAKLNKLTESYITLELEMNNGQGIDIYCLSRKWIFKETLSEKFEIQKNNTDLSIDEVADFEKYLLSLIPPELFNLYFFDGEKIADFFMNDGSNERIKEAFLTLCGYDTFDIMRRNFKRISVSNSNNSPVVTDYFDLKDKYEEALCKIKEIKNEIDDCNSDIDMCKASINELEKKYSQSGGVSREEWDKKMERIKKEEKNREEWNGVLKKWANDIIPFIMIRPLIEDLKCQITKENDDIKYKNFSEILNSKEIHELFLKHSADKLFDEIIDKAYNKHGDGEDILCLSLEQSAYLISVIDKILNFEDKEISNYRRNIKSSKTRTAKIREELENSSISFIQDYMKNKAELFEKKSSLLDKLVNLEKQLNEQEEYAKNMEVNLTKMKNNLEEELKKASINDISAKAIIMLDTLQNKLYFKQIEKVEENFRKEIKTLMRKTKFIDDIEIDKEFNVHIFKTETFSSKKLYNIFSSNSIEKLTDLLGEKAIKKLLEYEGVFFLSAIDKCRFLNSNINYELPVEIDKTSLSNGEKQIFIMALYHSLVKLCNCEIPFIIDTPFARIDTEHRNNISKYFFNELRGQVFILSTNEEIDSEHVQILKDNILATYILENTDNKRTIILENKYFEV